MASPEEGRSARKRRAIVDAARELFLQHGYAGTSMDDVAARAAVSKQTVYKQFGDKQRLFTELVTGDVAPLDVEAAELAGRMPDSDDVPGDLRRFARLWLAHVMQRDLVRMRRVLIGEAERFPDLAQAWYAGGPESAYTLFGGWFTALHRRGLLHAPDPRIAAEHFNWLVLSVPLNKAMAYPAEPPLFDRAALDRYADEGVRVFLAAYGPTPALPGAAH